MKNLLFSLLIGLLLSSCAFHSGQMTSNPYLYDANHELIALAIGTSSTTKLFGVGGLSTDALVLEAKKNLYSNYPLKRGQAYSNLSVDFKTSLYFVVFTTQVTISADIVQIDTVNYKDAEYQPIFESIRINQIISTGEICLGDTVKTLLSNKTYEYVVIKINSNFSCLLNPLNSTITKIKSVDRIEIYLTKNSNNKSFPFKIDQKVQINKSDGKQSDGTIIGLGIIDALIEEKQGEDIIVTKILYTDLKKYNK